MYGIRKSDKEFHVIREKVEYLVFHFEPMGSIFEEILQKNDERKASKIPVISQERYSIK